MRRWAVVVVGSLVAACGSILGVEPLTVDQQTTVEDAAPPVQVVDAAPQIIDASVFVDAPPDAQCRQATKAPQAVVALADGNRWSNLPNMMVEDGEDAMGAGGYGHDNVATVQATSFGFAIPRAAQIQGVTMRLKAHSNQAGEYVDRSIKFISGATEGAEMRVTTAWPSDYDDRTYGSEVSFEGLPLTPDLVNTADFGVELSAGKPPYASLDFTFDVDVVQVSVFYCE